MRGGERLVKECSWMRGICSRLYHSTEKYKTFSCRCPSSVMVNNRFRSADYLPCQLFNFGMIATGNHNFERFAALCNTPGGSWIFWQAALRNRLAKKTDEGQRYLIVSNIPVEWYNPEHLCQSSNLIHQPTVRRPSSVSRFRSAV